MCLQTEIYKQKDYVLISGCQCEQRLKRLNTVFLQRKMVCNLLIQCFQRFHRMLLQHSENRIYYNSVSIDLYSKNSQLLKDISISYKNTHKCLLHH